MAKKLKAGYTIKELAELLEWSKKRVRIWLRSTGVRTIKTGKQKKEVVPVEELFRENWALIHRAIHDEDDDDEK